MANSVITAKRPTTDIVWDLDKSNYVQAVSLAPGLDPLGGRKCFNKDKGITGVMQGNLS